MKIVIAYSGGLDTSVAISYLREKYNAEVIAYTSNIGQKIESPDILEERAIKAGAKKFYYEDLREKFVNEYIIPALKAGAIYQDKYPLATALSRPLIAESVIKIAKKEKADAVSHGCTGKGNDQIRFELTFKYLAPEIKIIAPLREWEFKSREEEIEYARKKGIPISVSKEKPYSIDENLWGISIECGVLEDPWQEPPEDAFQITNSPEKAPEKGEYIEIGFEKGIFVSLNGKRMDQIKIIEKVAEIGAKHGIGRIDMIEDRVIGIKSREVYEAPAAVILHTAHSELEKLVFSRDLYEFKKLVSIKYSQIIYFGQWFSHLRICLDKFIEETQKYVTGTVKLKLYKGNCTVVGRESPYSLYKEKLATYSHGDIFDHKASTGFIEIFGLPSKLEGERSKGE
ncbi:MAG: argininosuccinate synthase [Candidatus Omnitrophica bacterium]|nr:argininosuccinate synthase [Candidatus Omnitrophota bacterium]MCM8806766.1 argininosuccinate synthase [Candidatus Omnitrophota bacterium]